jgi:hypothetical protein
MRRLAADGGGGSSENKRSIPVHSRLFVAPVLCLALTCAHAEKYALLIGINRYTPAAGVNNLEGPVNDARSLRQTLISTWQFKPENVQTLFDAEATRTRILNALDAYAASLKPGDFLFLFYSGHGTSWFAQGMPQTGIAADTGAIVASDLGLIVGNRDLQPRLRKLDAVAQVFAVFDSCYSGNSIKSIALAPARYVPPEALKPIPGSALTQYDSQFSDFQRFTSAPSAYPYRRTLYLSAASKSEQAADIPSLMASHGVRRTVDGLPHGALTNALLKGLNGEADTNHDGKITYEELYQFVRQSVSGLFTQTPQFLFPTDDPRIASAPVFSVSNASAFAPTPVVPAPTGIRIKLEGAGALRAKLAAMPGVVLSGDLFDLLVREHDGAFELYHRSGTLIQKYPPGAEADLMLRIKAEPEVRKLVDLDYGRQSFNVSLTIEPDGRGFYALGDRLRFRAKTEADSYLLLLDIDVSGMVTLLYPRSAAEATKTQAGSDVSIGPESQVTQPVGMEYLKLFAFREKPAGLEALVGEAKDAFAPGTPLFDKLMRMVTADIPGRAATQVKLVTTE